MGCFIVTRFLLTSLPCNPSTVAELLVQLSFLSCLICTCVQALCMTVDIKSVLVCQCHCIVMQETINPIKCIKTIIFLKQFTAIGSAVRKKETIYLVHDY